MPFSQQAPPPQQVPPQQGPPVLQVPPSETHLPWSQQDSGSEQPQKPTSQHPPFGHCGRLTQRSLVLSQQSPIASQPATFPLRQVRQPLGETQECDSPQHWLCGQPQTPNSDQQQPPGQSWGWMHLPPSSQHRPISLHFFN